MRIAKITLRFNRSYVALFSNVCSPSPHQFYLLLTAHHTLKGGFGEPITIAHCKRLLRKHGFEYIEKP